MTAAVGATVEVLGKVYQVKCPEKDVALLQQAARFLEEKMRVIREATQALSADRLAIITALNIAHEFLLLETKQIDSRATTERLHCIQNKIDEALARHAQLEL